MVDWDQIVVTYGARVWCTAYRLLGRHDDALDCCQETFLAAYRAVRRGPIGNWEAFLTSVASRQAIDCLRRRTRLRRRFSSLGEAPEPIAAQCAPDEQAQEAERLEQVRELLSLLPAKQAQVFYLSSIEEMPHSEISRYMRITGVEVRVLLHRARARLRAALRELSPELRSKS
jgi:RNA polymerase sigma-70 factor (ECF subfamily)